MRVLGQQCARESFCGRGLSSVRAAGGNRREPYPETLRVQCGEDGVGRSKSGLIAYRAASGRLVQWGAGKRRRCREGCGLTRSRRGGGGLLPRGGKKRKTRLNVARRRDRQTRRGKLKSYGEVQNLRIDTD